VCGIAGVFSSRPIEPLRAGVERIVQSQHRRGPDFRAIESIHGCRAGAVLGHNRLAIIDLSPLGNQPMWDVDRRLCVVFNGEIYNYVELRRELESLGHRFASHSDTEVILESFKRWGTDALGRFNGMFAFALFDTSTQRLLLVRDRFGVKPLYYVTDHDTLHFASTTTAMAALLGLSPDLDYVSRGVRYSVYDHDDAAPYLGMKALRPGHYLEVGLDDSGSVTASLKPFYDLGERIAAQVDALAAMPTERLIQTVADLLDDSVRLRLRSDVPVAVSLSGGLDSCGVAALAARHHPEERLRGFTFGDPGVAASEGPLAAEAGKMFNVDVTYVWPGIGEICEAYLETLQAQGAPFPDATVVAQYLVFKTAHVAGFKVLLGGQGGDEAFMGYRKFQAFRLSQLAARKQYGRALAFAISLLPTFFAERWRWWDSWKARNRYLNRSGMSTVLRLPGGEMAIGYSPSQTLRARQAIDVTLASLPTLLRYEDGNSMGNSIESRLPFVDYRVMECGIALPEAVKLRGGHGKWIVRQAVAGMIPESIRTARYKRGFDVQEGRWIDGGLGEFIREMLRARSREVSEWLAPGAEIDRAFSNEQLKARPSAFAEATTLLWLVRAGSHAT